MKCNFCHHNMIRKKNVWKCEWCGNTKKYIPEPPQYIKFTDIKEFMEKINVRP